LIPRKQVKVINERIKESEILEIVRNDFSELEQTQYYKLVSIRGFGCKKAFDIIMNERELLLQIFGIKKNERR